MRSTGLLAEEALGGVVNELLTAYLRALYALRGGQLSAAKAMDQVVDLTSAAQSVRTSFGKLMGCGSRDQANAGRCGADPGTSGKDRHV
jgi:hypothetical protein